MIYSLWGDLNAESVHRSSSEAMNLWLVTSRDRRNPLQAIRHVDLSPSITFDLALKSNRDTYTNDSFWEIIAKHVETVRELVSKRSALLNSMQWSACPDNQSNPEALGRFLVFDPLLTMNDGIAEDESKGLFDVTNCPGWNFWVAYVVCHSRLINKDIWKSSSAWCHYLVCWIPNELVPLANKGVEANAEASILWADDFVARM